MSSDHKIKVLKISHTAALPSYRARERALVRRFPVELELVIPKRWTHFGDEQEDCVSEPFVIHRLATVLTDNIPLFGFSALPLVDIMKRFQPDIVDIHEEPYSVSGFQSVLSAKLYAPRAIRIFYTAQNIRKSYPPPFSWTEKFVYSESAAAYPCSSEAEAVLRAKGYANRAIVLPLGVDAELYKSTSFSALQREERRSQLNLKGFVFGYFGRLEPYKGVQCLLQAAASLPASISWTVVVIGSGSYKAALIDLVAELGISEHVVWLSETAAGDMPAQYALCDCIVVPSLTTPGWKEQFGRVPVEAMAAGVPVIASNSGSLAEVVGDSGVLTPEADVASMMECMRKLAGDAALRQRLIESGLASVAAKYTWDAIVERTYQLYCELLQS